MRRNKRNVLDSDVESETGSSDSDATVYNPKTKNKKQPLPQQKRGRPAGRKNAKRARVSDDSESDRSPQPSTSGLCNNTQSSTNDSNNSSFESDDSYYGPEKDVSLRKKNQPQRKRGRPPKNGDNGKKQKEQNNFVNGDRSPQPSTSGLCNNTQSSTNDSNNSSFESDDSYYGPQKDVSLRKKNLPQRKRGRPPKKGDNGKKQKAQNNSVNGDRSPQPSTSGLCNNTQNSTNDSSNSSSESESDDSDYGPEKDVSLRKKNLSQTKRGRLPKKGDNGKKQKAQNNFVNGVTPKKSSQNRSQLNTSNRKSLSNDVLFDAKQIESLAQKLVYFLLIEDQKKYAIRRKAITTHVFKDEIYSPKLYTAVIKKANFILKKVYGMEIMEVENQKDSYLIVNILKRELGILDYYDVSRLKQQQHGLILYLLTVIFMNDNVITEEELTKSLQPLGIDLTSKKVHPIFGDVKKYITTELVKQMYLSHEQISRDPPKYEIKWGIRAKQEFDKRDLLQFTCQIMADTTPESWKIQYKDAEKSANPQMNGNR